MMGNGSGKALGIIGMILAAGAIGFTFFVWNGQNTTNSDLTGDIADLRSDLNDLEYNFNNLNTTLLVGVWESLSRNTDYSPHNTNRDWLFEIAENQMINSEYLSLSNSNTRITLLKYGWYKIHLSALLSGILPDDVYSLRMYKNDVIYGYNSYLIGDSVYIYMDGTMLIECNATDYIDLTGYSLTDDFDVYPVDRYNHLTIEYLVE